MKFAYPRNVLFQFIHVDHGNEIVLNKKLLVCRLYGSDYNFSKTVLL